MPILRVESEYGHSCPPETPYAMTTNMPGWESTIAARDGHPGWLDRIVHLYPRIMPWSHSRDLMTALGRRLGLPATHTLLAFLHPCIFPEVVRIATNSARGDHILRPDQIGELGFRVVDVAGTRLYLVTFPTSRVNAVLGAWQNAGTGLSIRLAESLLPRVSTLTEVEWDQIDLDHPPAPTLVPETADHAALRERISGLLGRGAGGSPARAAVPAPGDVYLYPTGMAAIHYLNVALAQEGATSVILGALFHCTYHNLTQRGSCKHFGPVDKDGIDVVEAWMNKEQADGRRISYVLVEFPSNPTLASVDLVRLRSLTRQHNCVLVVDDTLGSYCNVDLAPVADLTIASLSKSFSGYADAMAGCVVLFPDSAWYPALKRGFDAAHGNELFAADAAAIRKNSEDYLARSCVLNRNAHAMADLLESYARSADSPVVRVLYPTVLPDRANYDAVLRRTADFEPGYGCLLSVDFESVETMVGFYHRLGAAFCPGPHLGAHRSLVFLQSAYSFGRPEEVDYHRSYGVLTESVRISAGLESTEDLLDSLRDALDAAAEVKREAAKKEFSAEG